MHHYSQNAEDVFVLNYFKDFKGTLLEIGANDGRTLSNSLLLIENGWEALLVEPGEVFKQLADLHTNNPRVGCYNYAIGETTNKVKFWESGAHIPGGSDTGLVSTTDPEETERWRKAGVSFSEKEIYMLQWKAFYDEIGRQTIDYISIDVEGLDWEVLSQIDLIEVGCKCLVIEWNGDALLYCRFVEYCGRAGLKLRVQNAENLIFTL